jgi:RNA polymerase sigma-70 factor (ECF subfamily)
VTSAKKSAPPENGAFGAVESVVRQSYGRLIAYLAARTGDVAGAEDALSDALVAALRRWPEDGLPDKPEAWLLHAARNRLIDGVRRAQMREKSAQKLRQIAEEAQDDAMKDDLFPDERLKLLFVCAHPAIDPAARTPLMLQTVLGIEAERIASAFLTSPAAMSQRLVRAKSKIQEAAIPFRVPEPPEWPERLAPVLDAVYAGYTTGWEALPDSASTHHTLAAEALELGRVLARLMPDAAEAHGLVALMLHCEARREARYNGGEFVPLDQQDTDLWSRPVMEEAEEHLKKAASFQSMGRFQLEAAIQSVHADRAQTGKTRWDVIAQLYEGVARLSPSVGSQVGRAVAVAKAGNPSAGFEWLEMIPGKEIVSYQPYWAARGHLLELLDRRAEAREAWIRASGLTDDPALRRYLEKRCAGTATF